MQRIKNMLKSGAIPLVTLLNSCTVLVKEQSSEAAITSPSSTSQPLPESRPFLYELRITAFNRYNPSLQEDKIAINPTIQKYLDGGLDADEDIDENRDSLQDQQAFEKLVYQDALQHNYTREQINKFSLRETATLIADLIAKRVNYFGKSSDYKTRNDPQQRLDKLAQIFIDILNDKTAGEGIRKDAQEKLKIVNELKDMQLEQRLKEAKISESAGYATGKFDKTPLDVLYKEREELSCRQYAELTNAIFTLLKKNNPSLKNTYCASYSDRNHRWNQLATVFAHADRKSIGIEFTFFDPTGYDTAGDIEGYNADHFKDFLMLRSQLMKISSGTLKTVIKEQPASPSSFIPLRRH